MAPYLLQPQIVNNAYNVLIDQEKRDIYDEKIGIKKKAKIFEEKFIKSQYETAIKMLNSELYRDVYDYLLIKTDSKYISKIIIDAAKQYNLVKKEKEEENIKEEEYESGRYINEKYEYCPKCGKKSERKYNVCEYCRSYKD